MIFLWAYLIAGILFSMYIVYQDGPPSDWTDFIALSLVIILAIILWPWFIAAALFDVIKRDKKKDENIMKLF